MAKIVGLGKRNKKSTTAEKRVAELKESLSNKKWRFSFSRINKFLTCPLKYKFHYVDRIRPALDAPALTMGTSVHKCMEYIYTCKAFNEKADEASIIDIVDANIDRKYCQYMTDKEWVDFVDYTKKLVLFYNKKKRKHKPLVIDGVVCTEFDFEVPVRNVVTNEIEPNTTIVGSIDLITEDLKLVDFKTSNRAYSESKVNNDFQPTCYSYAFRELFKQTESKFVFDVLIKKYVSKRNPDGIPDLKNYYTTRKREDWNKIFNLIKYIKKTEETNSFYPAYPNNASYCKNCEFKKMCEEWRPY